MPDGNESQVRTIAQSVAKATITEFVAEHPEWQKKEAEIPPPLKWAAGIVAALFTLGIGAMAVWLVTTVSEVQVTVARMDERMVLQGNSQEGRFGEIERRILQLETYHRTGDDR